LTSDNAATFVFSSEAFVAKGKAKVEALLANIKAKGSATEHKTLQMR